MITTRALRNLQARATARGSICNAFREKGRDFAARARALKLLRGGPACPKGLRGEDRDGNGLHHLQGGSEVDRFKAISVLSLGAFVFTGCTMTIKDGEYSMVTSSTNKRANSALRSICDVTRSRARIQLLKQLDIEKFRVVGLKISEEVSQDEIADLKRLEQAAMDPMNVTPEGAREGAELIHEIYTGAIFRAGLKPLATETIPGTAYSYTVGADDVTPMSGAYANIIVAHLGGEGKPGQYYQLSLSASPDQSRYYVELFQITGYETQEDGSKTPIFSTSSLYDAVDAMTPHHCTQVDSALSLSELNTIPGLKPGEGRADLPPAPAPTAAPGPVATAIPAPTAEPAPASTALPAPVRLRHPLQPRPALTDRTVHPRLSALGTFEGGGLNVVQCRQPIQVPAAARRASSCSRYTRASVPVSIAFRIRST